MPRCFPEPYKIKMVEPLQVTTKEYRQRCLEEAGYNTFLLASKDVFIDLLTDSGTSAMSDVQWAGLMRGDEAYAGSRNFYNLCEAVQEVLGYAHVVPTHQGRGAEHLFFQNFLRAGDVVPMNMYFTTTRQHAELAGGLFQDVIVDEAHDPASRFPWKGNVDLEKLRALVAKYGADRVRMVSVAPNVNMAGGQPCSMANLKELRSYCKQNGIRIFMDITRIAENAHFIKEREEGYAQWSIKDIVREICAHSDGAWMSAKKDGLVNIGGFLAFHKGQEDLFEQCRSMVVVYEGLHTYGGMAGRDMEALAIGLREVCQADYLAARVGQVRFLHELLDEEKVPLVHPCGGHGVFLNAREFLPHLDQDQYPAQMLAAQIYAEGGVRSMERGNVSAGRDPETGQNRRPRLELVRLTIPRRVYTQTHMEYTAESVIDVFRRREKVPGLAFAYEPAMLRFFQAQFAPIPQE